MTMHNETHTATLVRGPHDGTEVDVTDECEEVRRNTQNGTARYVRVTERLYHFVGYVENAAPSQEKSHVEQK